MMCRPRHHYDEGRVIFISLLTTSRRQCDGRLFTVVSPIIFRRSHQYDEGPSGAIRSMVGVRRLCDGRLLIVVSPPASSTLFDVTVF